MPETIVTVNGSGPTPIRITSASDPGVQVAFELPIKGRKPLSFKVPRLQYLPMDMVERLDAWITDRNAAIEAKAPESNRFYNHDQTIFLLELLLTPEQFAIVDRLTLGEKIEIHTEWEKASNAPLGKSSASPGS